MNVGQISPTRVRGGFDARDQMQLYVRWYREGHNSSTGRCFDIGNTVRAALHRFERTGGGRSLLGLAAAGEHAAVYAAVESMFDLRRVQP